MSVLLKEVSTSVLYERYPRDQLNSLLQQVLD